MLSKRIVDEIRQARSRIENMKQIDDPKAIKQDYDSLKEEIRKLDRENQRLKKECFRVHSELKQLLDRL